MRQIEFKVYYKNKLKGIYTPKDLLTPNGLSPDVYSIIDELIFAEYTGLNDINGKKIFEGDFILGAFPDLDWDQIYPFVYKQPSTLQYSFIISQDKPYREDWQFRVGCDGINPPNNKWQVIGNIYEDPEILSKSLENHENWVAKQEEKSKKRREEIRLQELKWSFKIKRFFGIN